MPQTPEGYVVETDSPEGKMLEDTAKYVAGRLLLMLEKEEHTIRTLLSDAPTDKQDAMMWSAIIAAMGFIFEGLHFQGRSYRCLFSWGRCGISLARNQHRNRQLDRALTKLLHDIKIQMSRPGEVCKICGEIHN